MATETIPVIDLGPFLAGEEGALDRAAKELKFALTEIGFYFIVNHGVPQAKIRDAFEPGEALPRPADREEARPQARPEQYRLPADARQYPAHLDGADRHQAQSQRGVLRQARDGRRVIPTCWPNRRFRGPNRWPDGLPGFRETVDRLLRHAGAAGAEDGASLCPRARPAGRVFRRSVQGLPVLAAHDALPAPGRSDPGRVRPGAAHRHQLPDAARAQRRAGPFDPHPERQVDRRASDRRRLCRERRPDAAALDQRLSSWRRRTAPSTAAAASATPCPSSATATSTGRSRRCRPRSGRTSRPNIRRPGTPTTWSGTRSATTTSLHPQAAE